MTRWNTTCRRPREYFDAGRITFLPHNVYAAFPQQIEMLYLLLMHLAGGTLAAAIPAQLLHAACGLLAVLTLAAWTPPGWPRATVAVVVGSVPWLAYLGCLAYVELGMVFFAAVAAVPGTRSLPRHRRRSWHGPGAQATGQRRLAADVCRGRLCGFFRRLQVPGPGVHWRGARRGVVSYHADFASHNAWVG